MNKVIELFQNKEIEKLKQENESKSKTIQKLQDFIYKHLVEDGVLIRDGAYEILSYNSRYGNRNSYDLAKGILDIVGYGEKNGSIEASKTLLNTTGYKNIPKLNSNIIEIKIQDRRLQ